MILSRVKPAATEGARKSASRKDVPKLEEFLEKRDYTGALTLLEFNAASGSSIDLDLWTGYCAFHLGDYKKAATIYEALRRKEAAPPDVSISLACCYFYLGMYPEARKVAEEAPHGKLKTRLLFHLAHKMGNEGKLMEYHQLLEDIIEDQLSLASIHYLRAHYQEAIDVYKRVLLDNRILGKERNTNRERFLQSDKYFSDKVERYLDQLPCDYQCISTKKEVFESDLVSMQILQSHRDYLALNVYVALCYYKLDYYDVAQEVLQVYLQKYPDSAIAINLKACNNFRLYNGNAAQNEMKQLLERISSSSNFGHDLIRHNIVVFRGGEGALQVLPSLVDVIPEARLNLVIYYLRQNEIEEAYELIKDLEPTVPQEYILKGIVNAVVGQEIGSRDNVKTAQQYFQLVGSSASECDTIPGRQCMASCFFLHRQFEEVLVYLNSIKTYFSNEDNFNYNYAQAQAASGYFKEAEEAFMAIRNEQYKNDYVYVSILAYCYIMNKRAQLAWELYLKMDTSAESFNLLQLIANTCYKVGEFWYAAKAFDVLERMDPSPEHWEGKRGACCGTFQYIVAEKQPRELLTDVIQLLRSTANSQAEQIVRVMRKWAKENRVSC